MPKNGVGLSALKAELGKKMAEEDQLNRKI